MKTLVLLLKAPAVLGAVVYGPMALSYPLMPFFLGTPDMARVSHFSLWFVAAFGGLTLLPNRYLDRVRALRRTYIVLAVFATMIGAFAIVERLATDFYGLGTTPAKVAFVMALFVSACCGWMSFWCYTLRARPQKVLTTRST